MMPVLTATQLFAAAVGEPCPAGPHGCFFCGGACAAEFPAAKHVPDTFTALTTVARRDSDFVCGGCVSSMQSRRVMDGHDKPQKTWMFNWIVTPGVAIPSRGPNAALREWLLNPPDATDFAVAISTTLQRHLLYRTPVNAARASRVVVRLDESLIDYVPAELRQRWNVARRVAAACGKPSLLSADAVRLAIGLAGYWSDAEQVAAAWLDCRGEPLSRLAAYLCPPMKECQHDHPSDLVASDLTVADITAPYVTPDAGV